MPVSSKQLFQPKTGDATGIPRTGRVSDLVSKWWFWALLMVSLFSMIIGRTVTREPKTPPKAYFTVPTFELLDQDNESFGSKNLRGKVWVANFIFTSCPGPCPRISKRMRKLQRHTVGVATVVHLVSFTVDPENDTPAVLRDYAKSYQANPRRWSFLTGDTKTVEDTIVNGFKLAMGKDAPGQIFHSERFVLVDKESRVRGLYDNTDEGMKTLLSDIGMVLNPIAPVETAGGVPPKVHQQVD